MNRASLISISSKNPLSFTSFGSDAQRTFGNGLAGHPLLKSERFFLLDRKQTYYDCTNHDSKMYDFDGRVVSGPRATMAMTGAEKAPFYVPLKMRRPSAPVRLTKVITDSFTNLLFGESRFPVFRCEADFDTEDFANTLVKVGELETKMISARNLGGSMGTVGLSWSFREGKPRFDVHNAKNLYVHSWGDREQLLPKHIIEVYLYEDTIWNGKEFAKQWYWYRRDWTPNADIVFMPCPYEEKIEPFWVPDLTRSYLHDDGVPHFEWIQNLPSVESIDGLSDYEGLFDASDSLDTMMSVVVRGGTLNLDPTLLLKMDAEQVNRMGIKKGSDNALIVGKDGGAEYMELSGEGLKAGLELIQALRRHALEVAQCIVPDPSEVAAQGVSSVAIKAMFAPMIGKTNTLRAQYGRAMKRMLEIMIEVVRSKLDTPIFVLNPETGEEEATQITLTLPPRVVKLPVPPPLPPKPPPGPKMVPHPQDPTQLVPAAEDEQSEEPEEEEEEEEERIDPEEDPDGAAEEAAEKDEALEPKVKLVERTPGKGEELDPKWGNYFTPTPDDLSKVATVFQTVTGGKAFISKQTATEKMAQMLDVDAQEEIKRVEMAGKQEKAEQADMMNPPANGGAVGHPNQLPPGAKPKGPPGGPPMFGGGPPKPPGGGGFGAKKPPFGG